MAGVERIKEKILDDARLQVKNIIEQAESEAADTIRSAQQEADSKKAVLLENAEKEAVELRKRLIAVAELEGRKSKLRVKQELIEEVFAKVLEKLNNMPKDQYESILIEMVVGAVQSGQEKIILSQRDKQRVSPEFTDKINKRLSERKINGNIALATETGNFNGGFILKSGDIEVNNSFEAIIKMQRDDLEVEVVKALFLA